MHTKWGISKEVYVDKHLVHAILGTTLLASFCCAGDTSAPFVWQGSGDVVYTVTADGLSGIKVGDKEVASGEWLTRDVSWMYDVNRKTRVSNKVVEKVLTVQDKQHCSVRHVQEQMVSTYDYAFDGEDVTIRARIENKHPTEEIAITSMGGLMFHFAKPAEGIMTVWHFTYTQAAGLNTFHPSHINKIGGSYARDGQYGVGLTPLNTKGLARTDFYWDWTDWGRYDGTERILYYYRCDPILPDCARTFEMKMRISRNTEWKHLLQPYKDYFLATYGSLCVVQDHRWVAQACVNGLAEWIPYGFHGGCNRLDTPQGVREFGERIVPTLKAANALGVIFWGQGGTDPRGAMYRPDFDVLPPEVEQNWPTLHRYLEEAGLRLGVCARPGDLAYRATWKTDGVMRISADSQQQMDMLWKRFKNMIDKGCTLFYLDSFGGSYDDARIMRFLREKMGPDILTYVEHQNDVVMAYSGGAYLDCDYLRKGATPEAREDGIYARVGMHNWEIFDWLLPGIMSMASVHGVDSGHVEWAFKHRMVSKIVHSMGQEEVNSFLAIMSQYVDEKGNWKR